MEIRNQLGVLLETVSLSSEETNRNYAQKEGAKPGMSSGEHESSATTQKTPRLCQMGIKVDTSSLGQVSQIKKKLGAVPQDS